MKQPVIWFAILIITTSTIHAGKFDPLDEAERLRVTSSARIYNESNRATNPTSVNNRSTNINSDYELLLVERHRTAKNAANRNQRLADVYWYDYSRDVLIVNLVNAANREIRNLEESQGTQLPLTDNEIQRALNVLFSDQTANQRISREYQSITGQPLTDYTSQVEMKAFVFYASTAPLQRLQGSQQCGINRCAQIMLFTPDRVAFELMPIVNLSKNVVSDILIGF